MEVNKDILKRNKARKVLVTLGTMVRMVKGIGYNVSVCSTSQVLMNFHLQPLIIYYETGLSYTKFQKLEICVLYKVPIRNKHN